jgi:protein gp37
MKTRIEWTEETWNPTVGCSKVSPGCKSCYAIREARRAAYNPKLAHIYQDVVTPKGEPLNWTGKVNMIEQRLDLPRRWKTPRTVFVDSMSDLFHESVPDEVIDQVFAVMALCPQHTFQVLTKRAERMYRYFEDGEWYFRTLRCQPKLLSKSHTGIPANHIWLGVSCEDQQRADERIPWLLKTPAAVRFLSLEPLLGPVDLSLACIYCRANGDHECDGSDSCRGKPLDWVILGGESGPGARPCNVQWIRDVVRQCREARVPCFVKQAGAKPVIPDAYPFGGDWPEGVRFGGSRDGVPDGCERVFLASKMGADPSEWPADLRVRKMPEVRHG